MELNSSSLALQISTNPYISLFSTETRRLDERSAFEGWMMEKFHSDFVNDRCFSVNLTFVADINRESAQAQFKNFVGYLNRQIYGNSYKRKPKEKYIKLLAVIEGGGNTGKEVHYHTIIVNPYDRSYTDDEFSSLIKHCWLKQPKSMKNSDVAVNIKRSYTINDWIKYLAKSNTKDTSNDNSYLDFLDIQSSYF
jgi:hypothetical protein